LINAYKTAAGSLWVRSISRRLGLARLRVEVVDAPRREHVAIILPVLNEGRRILPCLHSLMAQPEEATEILVVDGGSNDDTRDIVERCHARDQRVRLIDASPIDPSWTGKAWGLSVGLNASRADSEWILFVDADIRVAPELVRSLLHHAAATGIFAFSLATAQKLSGVADSLVHPAFLTTLVYRFGIPGKSTKNLHKVLANGQCFISRRETLLRTNAVQAAQNSLCEDITIARRLAECGVLVGFYESDGLVEVRMYDHWRETWRNWPRSLVLQDQYFGWHEWLGLAQVLLLQALPLPVFVLCALGGRHAWLAIVAGSLALLRLGILVGAARAYKSRPWTYWLSPALDLPVAVKLIATAVTRKHEWRGKTYLRRAAGRFELVQEQTPSGPSGRSPKSA
jgi:dolichol-phosphate mannosyltransferase